MSIGVFMSFLFAESFSVVVFGDRSIVRALGSWENEVTVTTVEDIGALTATIALEDLGIRNQVVYTAGETISYARLAEIVEHHVNRHVERELWSVEYLKEELRKAPDNALEEYRVVFAEGKGVAWPLERTYNHLKNVETEDTQHWLMQHVARPLKE